MQPRKRPLMGPFPRSDTSSEHPSETELHEISAGGISGADIVPGECLVESGFQVETHSRVIAEAVAYTH